MGVGHTHALHVDRDSPVHRLPGEVKVVATIGFVVAVAITPREAVPAFAIYLGLVAIGVALARIPIRFMLLRLAGVLPFVIFAFFLPFISGGPTTELLWFTVSVEGVSAMFGIIAKAGLGASASILLVATTEVPGVLRGLSKVGMPSLLVSIAGFMIRYVELVVDELHRVRVAMASRGFRPRWLKHTGPIAAALGSLFVRSYERGERVHQAMVSRGFTGTMPVLVAEQVRTTDWVAAMVLPAIAIAVAIGSLVVW